MPDENYLNAMEMGLQPLDRIMQASAWDNHDLVAASKEKLTHKMVSKGRKGRKLTLNVQHKILNAVNAVSPEQVFVMKDLFNYAGKK